MNTEGPFYEQIEDYLAGRLTPEQEAAMRQALRDDPELAREVELRRLEFEAAEELIAGNIRDQLRQLRTEQPPDAPLPRKYHLLRWLLAALLCSVAFGIYWWTTRTPEQIQEIAPPRPGEQAPAPAPSQVPQAGNPPKPDTDHPTDSHDAPAPRLLALATELYQRPDFESLRSTEPDAAKPLDAAMNAWQKQDYAAVVAALRNVGTGDPQYWRAVTLRAHAQFNLKQFQRAAQSFTDLADNKVQPWAEDADGYLLLALLADGRAGTAEFKARLQKVLSDAGHPWFEMARQIQMQVRN